MVELVYTLSLSLSAPTGLRVRISLEASAVAKVKVRPTTGLTGTTIATQMLLNYD